ncbi:MAG TPA: pantoate--beta-alanine ligase, partial [Nannocystaceae bacterium]|nr:pantoate--beta-alanine ligase [Nannocystaceae bacterium]
MSRHVTSLHDARLLLREMHRTGREIGSIHTLGALHEGHRRVISLAAAENDEVVVTIYPNRAQLAPGTVYRYDLAADVELAFAAGATLVVSSTDDEMYPPGHETYLDLGAVCGRLDGTVMPRLFRGMVTMCLRWISFVRPRRSYWGEKDIGQLLLVERSVRDLLVDCEIRRVPCVRYRSGIPISSRLMALPRAQLVELESVYAALQRARCEIAAGERRAAVVLAAARRELRLSAFELCYAKAALAADFTEPAELGELPLILHIVVTNGTIHHFDGLLLADERALA